MNTTNLIIDLILKDKNLDNAFKKGVEQGGRQATRKIIKT